MECVASGVPRALFSNYQKFTRRIACQDRWNISTFGTRVGGRPELVQVALDSGRNLPEARGNYPVGETNEGAEKLAQLGVRSPFGAERFWQLATAYRLRDSWAIPTHSLLLIITLY